MKAFFGIVVYFIASGGFLFKKNNNELNITNSTELKGISAILIILTHCITAYDSDNVLLNNLSLGWLVVAVFFFLSGYGIAHGYKAKENYFDNFLKNRFVKLLIPFIIANVIYLPIKLSLGTDITVKYLLLCALGKKSIVSYSWYVTAILLMYIIFWISFKFFKKHNIFILVALLILFTTAEYFFYTKNNDYWFISNLSFAFGIIYRLFNIDRIKKYYTIPVAVFGFLGSVLLIPVFNNVLGFYSSLIYVISCNLQSAFFALIIASFIPLFQFNNFISGFLGKISYEIYLYHGLFIFLFQKIEYFQKHFLLFFIAVSVSSTAFSKIMNTVDNKLIKLFYHKNENPKMN